MSAKGSRLYDLPIFEYLGVMGAVDDQVSQWMKRADESGELRSNPHFGKPLDLDDGFLDTPEELRMGYKILKNAGFVPVEVEMMQQVSALKKTLAGALTEDQRQETEKQLAYLQTKLAISLEMLRDHARSGVL